jgi:TolA-binding protein
MTTFFSNLLGINKPSFDGISGQIIDKVGEMNINHQKFVTEINNKLDVLNAIVKQTKQKINRNNQLISEQPDNIEELQQENAELQQQLEDIQKAVDNYLLKMDYSKDNAQILARVDSILNSQPVGNAVTINREPIEKDEDEVTTGIRGPEQLANDKQEDEAFLREYGVPPNKNKKDKTNEANEANEAFLRAYGVPPPSTSIRPQSPPGPPPGPLNLPPGDAGNPDHSSGIIKGGYVYKSPFRSRSTKKHNKSSRRTRTHGGRYRRKRQTKFKRRYSIF